MKTKTLSALALIFCFAALNVQAAKVKEVNVVNTTGEPLPVTVEGAVPVIVDEPVSVSVPEPISVDVDTVREPFHFEGFIIRQSSTDPFQVPLFALPGNKSLVIETISIAAFGVTSLFGPTLLCDRDLSRPCYASPILVQNGTSDTFSSLSSVRIRIDAGTAVDGIVNAIGRFRFMISGYLRPVSN